MNKSGFTRTAALVLGGGALVAWFAAVATSGHLSSRTATDETTGPPKVDGRAAALAGEIDRLRARLAPDATLRDSKRNLFSYRQAPASLPPAADAPRPAALAEVPVAALAPLPAPALKFEGLAEDPGPPEDGRDAAPIRIAIISGQGQLFMVKQGDSVTSRYRVARISEDVVELTDTADGTLRRLALK